MKRLFTILFCGIALSATAEGTGGGDGWVATWAAAPQLAAGNDMPAGSDLSWSALRQVVHVSAGGGVLRLKLSNEYSKEPVEIKSVYIATATDSSAIDTKSAKYLTFNKKKSVTIAPGKTATSDEAEFDLKPLQLLAVTVNYGDTPAEATSHLGSRTTSYIIKGEAKPKTSFAASGKVEHWYNIAAIDVKNSNAGAIAVIGNSITDGRGSTTDRQNRWTDVLAESLAANGMETGVLNLGIGGNCVLAGGLGTPALERYGRDVLGQCGVRAVIIFEGINDIGGSKGTSEAVAEKLIEAYVSMAESARRHGMKVYGATITPIKNSFYYSHFHEAARLTVNDWIRNAGCFDGVIDFDKAVRDPADPSALRKEWQQDWLHPNAEGYKVMGEYAAEVILKDETRRK